MRSARHWLIWGAAALLWSAGVALGQETTAPAPEPSAMIEAVPADAPAAATPETAAIQAHYAQGRALYQQGRFEEARAEFAEALRLRQAPATGQPVAPPSEIGTAPPTASAPSAPPSTATSPASDQVRELYATGRALYQQGRFEEARAAFAAALQMPQGVRVPQPAATVQVDIEAPLPEHLQTRTWLQQTRRQRQQVLRHESAADRRLEALRREIRRQRERLRQMPAQHAQRAKWSARLAAAEQAFAECQTERERLAQQAGTLTRHEAAWWYNWGVEADMRGDAGNAMARYRQAIALNPRHTGAHYNLATAFLRRRHVRRAEETYRQLLAVDPQDADAHYNLGVIAEAYHHAPHDALAHYRAYLAAAPPEAPERSLVQGWVNVIEGQRKEASLE